MVYDLTLRSHSCSFTDSKSVSTVNSSVDLNSADFNHSNRPCEKSAKIYAAFMVLSKTVCLTGRQSPARAREIPKCTI